MMLACACASQQTPRQDNDDAVQNPIPPFSILRVPPAQRIFSSAAAACELCFSCCLCILPLSLHLPCARCRVHWRSPPIFTSLFACLSILLPHTPPPHSSIGSLDPQPACFRLRHSHLCLSLSLDISAYTLLTSCDPGLTTRPIEREVDYRRQTL
jgi:hypothetical protein